MARVTFDRSKMIDLLEDQRRIYEPFVSVKKNGLVKFNAGAQRAIGDINRVDEVLGDKSGKRVIIILDSENVDGDDNRSKVKTKKVRETPLKNPKTGNDVVERLGEITMKSQLHQCGILPLNKNMTEFKFGIDTGLTIDIESEEGKIVIELDGKKGTQQQNANVNE